MSKTLDHLFVLGRPASGKSEFLDMLNNLSGEERAERMRIGDMVVLDDFVWLWEKFEEDDIWERIGKGRLHSKRSGHAYILDDKVLFDFLIEKLNYEILNRYQRMDPITVLIEFSRGGEAPYEPALNRFDTRILTNAAILYIEVSHAESQRRNEARYQEKLKSSVLAHRAPEEDMKRFYQDDDWAAITKAKREGTITLNGVEVPFLTLHNEPELKDPKALAERYSPALQKLYELTV